MNNICDFVLRLGVTLCKPWEIECGFRPRATIMGRAMAALAAELPPF